MGFSVIVIVILLSVIVGASVFLLVTLAVLFDRVDADECGFPLVNHSGSFCPSSFRVILC